MKTRQKGTAIVEFALVLPLLLLLTFITTEFGRAMYQYNIITKSVRDAVRYLSVQTPGTNTAAAKNLVVYGNTAGTGTPLALGLTLANVATPTWQTAGSDPLINTVTVTVTGYKFTPLYGNVFGVAFADATGKITYSNISATMRSAL
ncbi:Flp pilus assembly protein TadG [Collimonas sp. OK242]|jgi:Flp pilus assembly protein TadG|uniref:TadE/TadG family type IV pilus assembly protein n=1 Tax=Collimonas sp. OK242 TaxID=1798195 RepID=UPI00089CBD07|nr:TadE family protein [Collimonas sp. OK242]SDY55105.1 Flp pilus assembly protein TadG [Collimonas sp. OK242]